MAIERERRVPHESGQPEQSMDEILASIRQIIADDGAEKAPRGERRGLTPPSDVSNSNSAAPGRRIPTAPPARATTPEPASIPLAAPNNIDDELAVGMAQALAVEPEPQQEQTSAPAAKQPMRSATELALQRLNTEDVARSVVERWIGTHRDEMSRQIEQVVEPVVRAWLAENLPALVERLVREEIEAVSRGTRR